MENLQIFKNKEFGQVRTVNIKGEPWFVGKDVAVALGYKDTINALKAHIDEEDKRGWRITTPSGEQTMTIINESGLYSLIFGSKLESAKRFKHWVTNEVLPALRKTGHYETPQYKQQVKQRDLTKDDYIRAASIISGCRNERLPYVMAFLEKAGLDMPEVEQISRQAEIVAQSGLAPDGKLEEYANELMEMGLIHKKRIYVTVTDFNAFCIRSDISPLKYKRWLYRNRFIRGVKSKNGKLEYTATVWLDGEQRRCIVFEP